MTSLHDPKANNLSPTMERCVSAFSTHQRGTITTSPSPTKFEVLQRPTSQVVEEFEEPQVNRGYVFKSKRGSSATSSFANGKQFTVQWAEETMRKGWMTVVRSALCGCANLSTSKGRRNNALLILTIAIMPVFALIIQNALSVNKNMQRLLQSTTVKGDVLFSTESGNVIHYLQIERGTSALYISSRGASGLNSLNDTRHDTDVAIDSLTHWVGAVKDGPEFVTQEALQNSIRDFRNLVTHLNVTVPQNVAFYTNYVTIMIKWLADAIQMSQSGTLWPTLVAYHMLIISKEQAGLERALGSTFYAQGKI
jgi:hypothetical protein